ncbi:MAG: hypothetical protein ACYSWP_11770 [Planctomycetota bacterium]|jgi:hypothetical protein
MYYAELIVSLIRGFARFVAEIVQYCAWPAALLIVFWWLRKPIVAAIGRFKKIQHKDTTIEFELVKDLRREVSGKKGLSQITPDNLAWDDYLDSMEQQAMLCGVIATIAASSEEEIGKAKGYKERFDEIYEFLLKYRPDKFNNKLVKITKKAVDALGLDEKA